MYARLALRAVTHACLLRWSKTAFVEGLFFPCDVSFVFLTVWRIPGAVDVLVLTDPWVQTGGCNK